MTASSDASMMMTCLNRQGLGRQFEALVEGVWADHPPATARKTLQGYVHHLRRAVGEDVILTDGAGYRLAVAPGQVDAARFEPLAEAGRGQLGDRPDLAVATLSSALALWTGRAFEDLDDAPGLIPEIQRLDELRMATLTDRIAAELELDVTRGWWVNSRDWQSSSRCAGGSTSC